MGKGTHGLETAYSALCTQAGRIKSGWTNGTLTDSNKVLNKVKTFVHLLYNMVNILDFFSQCGARAFVNVATCSDRLRSPGSAARATPATDGKAGPHIEAAAATTSVTIAAPCTAQKAHAAAEAVDICMK